MPAWPTRLDAGRVSLDLMATLGNRSAERLPDCTALEAWLLAAGLFEARRRTSEDELVRTRRLRAALFALVDAELAGRRPPEDAVTALNAAAANGGPPPRLVAVRGGLRADRAAADVNAALGVIARDAIDLLVGPERALLRECAADDCSGVYVDRSRGRRRRWCSSERCGNRARVAAHRARAKT
jgi:predicted RNA-binding Zn ribbon-like protein